jgi:hypothetical protein
MTDYDNETELPMVADDSMVATLNKSEIDQQITTAKKYPRSVVKFRKEALEMVTLNESVAESCVYALPRDGKTIEGPSARFAEIIFSAWGNSRSGARTVSDQGDFVTSQGVYHDLERNAAITFEVQRRIVDKNGRRYKPDMIGVTANAACSIALRNAILKGIPKAFWNDLYEAARQTIRGDFKTLANRRADTLAKLQGYGVTKEQACAALGIDGPEDIGLDELVTLRGMLTALREGDTTPEQAFAPQETVGKPKVQTPQPKNADPAKTVGGTVETKAESLPQNGEEPPKTMFGDALARRKEAQKAQNGNGNGNGNSILYATEGEKKFLMNKLGASGLSLDEAMERAGVTDFNKLTADGFIALKEVLQAAAEAVE